MHDGSFILRAPTMGECRRPGLYILATCTCGHSRKLEPAKVCVSNATEIDDVGKLLTCSQCGTKGLDTRLSG